MEKHNLLFKWLDMKVSKKYDDINVELEFNSADLLNGKLALRKNFTKETTQDPEKVEYLESLLHQLACLTSVEDVQDEIDRMNRQDNGSE